MGVHVTFDHDPAEIEAAARAAVRGSPRAWLLPLAVAAVSVATLAFVVLPAWRVRPTREIVVAALPWVALCACWLVLIPALRLRAARALFASEPVTTGPQRRSLDEEGLYLHVDDGTRIHLPWYAIARCVETQRHFLFYADDRHAHYLPKHALSPADLRAVRAIVRAALGERARVAA